MDLMVSLLTQKNEYIDGLVQFTSNERLRERFFERMAKYLDLWASIDASAQRYIQCAASIQSSRYRFLTQGTGATRSSQFDPDSVD